MREQELQIKYLRKVLGQVDNRIQVPESVDAFALRPMLDKIEHVKAKDTVRRRPFLISLQSGIAYAAAFVLIVALFYSMERYHPEIMDGGITILNSNQSAEKTAGDTLILNNEENNEEEPLEEKEQETFVAEEPEAVIQEAPASDERSSEVAAETFSAEDNLGGLESVLLLEDKKNSYYARSNDAFDSGGQKTSSLEVVDKSSGDIVAQMNISDMQEIDRCFMFEDSLIVLGQNENGVAICSYSDLEDSAPQLALEQPGTLVDARIYNDYIHIVSISDAPLEDSEVVALPHTENTETCIITAINLETLETTQKSFTGVKGSIQLHNLNAYIHYEGLDESGENTAEYIGQILLDGMNIELGTVS